MKAPYVNALTADVEDYFQVAAFAESVSREEWESFRSRVEQNTARLLTLFDEAGTRATVFVLGWVAERFPQLVREIHACGHEVACHGQSHELIYSQSEQKFREETLRAKSVLEELIGTAVLGYRAASY